MAFTVKGVFVYVRDLCCKITLAKTNEKKKWKNLLFYIDQ